MKDETKNLLKWAGIGISIFITAAGVFTTGYMWAIRMEQNQEAGFAKIEKQLQIYFATDEQLNDEWLELDKGDHEKALNKIHDCNSTITTVGSKVTDVYQIASHLAKDLHTDLVDAQRDIKNDVNDLRVEVQGVALHCVKAIKNE